MTLQKIFPFLVWLKSYRRAFLRADLFAGMSVGLVLIPQSMANAQLAGLPPYCGLYAALLPTILGGFFSSSRQMCNGMVALIAMMTASALEPLAIAGTSGYIAYAILLSFMVGLTQLTLGVFRLGFLVSFLSQPVISGFTNATVILIALSQVNKIFGVIVETGDYQLETLYLVLSMAVDHAHWPTFGMACLAAAIIYTVPRFAPRLPAVLAAVMITTIISWAFNYEDIEYAPINAVESVEARALMSELIHKGEEIRAVSNLRANLNLRVQKVGYRDADLLLDLRFQLEQAAIKASQILLEMSSIRTKLRVMEFGKTQDEHGLRFYDTAKDNGQKTSLAQKGGSVGWRVLIGNDAIDPENIAFSGGGSVVGTLPRGLPSLSVPHVDFSSILQLFPFAITIAFIGIASSISIAKTIARSTNERIDPNQELIAQGLANLGSGLSQSSPVAGSFSSSAMNVTAGGKSGLSSVFAGLSTMFTLIFLTPLLYHLPQSVLAAVVITAMLNQINFEVFKHEWRAQWYDGTVGIVTFIITLAAAPQMHYGLIAGVALSLIVLVYRSMAPGVTRLTATADKRMTDAELVDEEVCKHIAVLRFQQSLFYINSNVLEEYVLELVERQPELRHIHLVCTGINEIDVSGEESLIMLVRWLRLKNVTLTFNGLNEKVYNMLERTGMLDAVGRENIFHTMQEAICAAHARLSVPHDCDTCPWKRLC